MHIQNARKKYIEVNERVIKEYGYVLEYKAQLISIRRPTRFL